MKSVRIDGAGDGVTHECHRRTEAFGLAIARCLGGAAAEALLLGVADLSFAEVEPLLPAAAADFMHARAATGLEGAQASYVVAQVWPAVVARLRRRRDALDAVAEALAAEGELDGATMDAVVQLGCAAGLRRRHGLFAASIAARARANRRSSSAAEMA